MKQNKTIKPFRPGPRAIVIALVLLLLAIEVALATIGGYGATRIVLTSARFGHRLLPGQTVRVAGALEEINSLGYRDREFSLESQEPQEPRNPRDNGLRIAALGASVTYGVGVEECDTWPRRLEQELRRRLPGHEVQVMNFAVPGYGLEAISRAFEDHVLPLQPDVIILSLGPYAIRPFVQRKDAALFPLHALVRRSALFDAVQRKLRTLRPAHEDLTLERRLAAAPFATEHDALWSSAGERLEALIDLFEAHKIRVLLFETPLLEPNLDASHSAAMQGFAAWSEAHKRHAYLPTGTIFSKALTDVMTEAAAQGGAEAVWHREPARRSAQVSSETFFQRRDPLHLTPAGHRLVAETVLSGLEESGMLRGRDQ